MEKGRSILAIIPFILTDAFLAIIAVLLFRLDFIVNSTLYQYGLIFNTGWATSYWATIRLSLTIIAITMILIPILGYVSLSNNAVQIDKATVYVCKTCQTSWYKVNKISQVNGQLPKLTVVKACSACDEGLLDWTMDKHAAQTQTTKRRPTSASIPIIDENE